MMSPRRYLVSNMMFATAWAILFHPRKYDTMKTHLRGLPSVVNISRLSRDTISLCNVFPIVSNFFSLGLNLCRDPGVPLQSPVIEGRWNEHASFNWWILHQSMVDVGRIIWNSLGLHQMFVNINAEHARCLYLKATLPYWLKGNTKRCDCVLICEFIPVM